MIVAIDVHYKENTAKAVGALIQNWDDAVATQHVIRYIDKVEEYVPGGESNNPLYVTAIGADLQQVADDVKRMHGEFRLPTILKELDRITKEA